MLGRTLLLTLLLTFSAKSPAEAQQALSLLSKEKIVGSSGNWMVYQGENIDGDRFCSAGSLTSSSGGRMALRAFTGTNAMVEWQLFPSDVASGQAMEEIEAKKVLIAGLSPRFYKKSTDITVEGEVSIEGFQVFAAHFTNVKAGSSQDLQDRYWWLTKVNTMASFKSLAVSEATNGVMSVRFPNMAAKQITLSLTGFRDAVEELDQCSSSGNDRRQSEFADKWATVTRAAKRLCGIDLALMPAEDRPVAIIPGDEENLARSYCSRPPSSVLP